MYSYAEQRPWLFTEEGLKAVAFAVKSLQRMGALFTFWDLYQQVDTTGDSYKKTAIIDYLREIHLIQLSSKARVSQDDVYRHGIAY